MHQPHPYKDKINNEVTLNNNNHRFIFILKGQCLSSNDSKTILFFKAAEVKKYFTIKAYVFLGEFNNNFFFACEINEKQSLLLKKIGHFSNLRMLAANLSVEESHIAAKATALINWHKINKFCKKCGAKTSQYLQGQTRKCDSIKCEYQIFPRLDPAIIVLVIDQSRCLLGRPKNWPHLQFSTIAGFVEPAESLEDAVIREVFEETGLQIKIEGDLHMNFKNIHFFMGICQTDDVIISSEHEDHILVQPEEIDGYDIPEDFRQAIIKAVQMREV